MAATGPRCRVDRWKRVHRLTPEGLDHPDSSTYPPQRIENTRHHVEPTSGVRRPTRSKLRPILCALRINHPKRILTLTQRGERA